MTTPAHEERDQGAAPDKPCADAGTHIPRSPEGLPVWIEGRPPQPGTYFGFSTDRPHDTPSLYQFDGENFQHWTGWLDHAVTHWMPTDIGGNHDQ